MKKILGALLTISAAALLVACGGGSDTVATAPAQPTAHAQPAAPAVPASASPLAGSAGVFVASGQASTTISLIACTTSGVPARVALNPSTASLRIDANGDMTFTYAGSNSPLIPTLAQTIVSSTALEATLGVSADASSTTENFYDAYLEDTNNNITLRFYLGGTKRVQFRSNTPSIDVECNIDPTTVVSANFGDFNARIAAVTSGVTSVSTSSTSATFASPVATWQNNSAQPLVQTRLNITTGVLERTPPLGGNFSPLQNIAQIIAPANGANEPSYSEVRGTDRNGPFQEISYSESPNGNNDFTFRVRSGTQLIPSARY